MSWGAIIRVDHDLGGGRYRVAEGLPPADEAVLRLDPDQENVEAGSRLARDFALAAADLIGDLQQDRFSFGDFHGRPRLLFRIGGGMVVQDHPAIFLAGEHKAETRRGDGAILHPREDVSPDA